MGSARNYRPCLHLLILVVISVSVASAALFGGRLSFDTKLASPPTNGLSVSGVAAAVLAQDDQALRPPLLPLTIASAQPAATALPLPLKSPEPDAPADRFLAASADVDDTEVLAEPDPAPLPVFIVYTVQEGDTVGGLATRYAISSSSILWNNLELESADSLVPGQSLRIPMSDGIIYDVGPGDTLSDIAARFAVDVEAIIDFPGNDLASADAIAEGQTIFVPGGAMPLPVGAPEPERLPEPADTPLVTPDPPTPTPEPPSPPSDDVAPSDLGARAVELARSRTGSPYVPGGAGPNAFDCSGLVYWVYSQLGVAVPRSAADQYGWATPVDSSDMQPGDLVFFSNTGAGGISHVGIYAGGGGVIMAVDNGDIVREVSLGEAYWADHFAAAGRPR